MTYHPPTVAELEAHLRWHERDLCAWQRIGDAACIAAYQYLLREDLEALAWARQGQPLTSPLAYRYNQGGQQGSPTERRTGP